MLPCLTTGSVCIDLLPRWFRQTNLRVENTGGLRLDLHENIYALEIPFSIYETLLL